MADPRWDALESAWEPARAGGVIGPASLLEFRQNAAGFIPAAFGGFGGARCVDLGSGAGVPGLLLALMYEESEWLLVDSMERRCAFAEAAVNAVGLQERVQVIHGRAEELAHDPDWRGSVDLVVARLFGDASELAECAIPLLAPGGLVVASVSKAGEQRWREGELGVLDAAHDATWSREGGLYVSVRRGSGLVDAHYPRRPAARRRSPLF